MKKTGTGIDKLLPQASKECIDLIKKMLAYEADDRITANQALHHDYFKDLVQNEQLRML